MTTTNSAAALVNELNGEPHADESRPQHPHLGGLSLTRRGRLVLLGLPVLLAAAAALTGLLLLSASLFNQAQASTAEQPGVDAVEVSVNPGDTLWSLADQAPTDGDIREVMAQITEINSLESSALQPGEVIYLPAD